MCETRSNFRVVLSSSGGFLSYSEGGGSAFVRRRIQTPSDATVLNVVQPEREVVLGASSPARRITPTKSGTADTAGEMPTGVRLGPWRRHGLASMGLGESGAIS